MAQHWRDWQGRETNEVSESGFVALPATRTAAYITYIQSKHTNLQCARMKCNHITNGCYLVKRIETEAGNRAL